MTSDKFDPRVAQIPSQILDRLAVALGCRSFEAVRASHGTTGRTFIISAASDKHVLRIEAQPAYQLKRAIAAQNLARSMKVAVPEVVAVADDDPEWFWYLEKFAPGVVFPHANFDNPSIKSATLDLGKQLRSLHSIPINAFGLLPPNPWLNFESAALRYQSAAGKIDAAFLYAKLDLTLLPQARSAFSYIISRPATRACLCKGDCRSSNILINNGKLSAIIDWEWACGDLSSLDIAAWHFSNEDPGALDLLLSAYEPDDVAEFRREVAAQIAIGIVAELLVYQEHSNFIDRTDLLAGIEERKRKLLEYLKQPVWLE